MFLQKQDLLANCFYLIFRGRLGIAVNTDIQTSLESSMNMKCVRKRKVSRTMAGDTT